MADNAYCSLLDFGKPLWNRLRRPSAFVANVTGQAPAADCDVSKNLLEFSHHRVIVQEPSLAKCTVKNHPVVLAVLFPLDFYRSRISYVLPNISCLYHRNSVIIVSFSCVSRKGSWWIQDFTRNIISDHARHADHSDDVRTMNVRIGKRVNSKDSFYRITLKNEIEKEKCFSFICQQEARGTHGSTFGLGFVLHRYFYHRMHH